MKGNVVSKKTDGAIRKVGHGIRKIEFFPIMMRPSRTSKSRLLWGVNGSPQIRLRIVRWQIKNYDRNIVRVVGMGPYGPVSVVAGQINLRPETDIYAFTTLTD